MYIFRIYIVISEERSRGLQTWLQDSFNELHDTQTQKLAVAGIIVEEIRASIYKETGFRCSAGISQNKVNILVTLHFNDLYINLMILFNVLDISKIGMWIT